MPQPLPLRLSQVRMAVVLSCSVCDQRSSRFVWRNPRPANGTHAAAAARFFSIFPLSTHFTAAFLAVWLSLFFGPQTLVSRLHLLRLPFYNGAGRKNDMEKLLGYYRLGFNRHTVQF